MGSGLGGIKSRWDQVRVPVRQAGPALCYRIFLRGIFSESYRYLRTKLRTLLVRSYRYNINSREGFKTPKLMASSQPANRIPVTIRVPLMTTAPSNTAATVITTLIDAPDAPTLVYVLDSDTLPNANGKQEQGRSTAICRGNSGRLTRHPREETSRRKEKRNAKRHFISPKPFVELPFHFEHSTPCVRTPRVCGRRNGSSNSSLYEGSLSLGYFCTTKWEQGAERKGSTTEGSEYQAAAGCQSGVCFVFPRFLLRNIPRTL